MRAKASRIFGSAKQDYRRPDDLRLARPENVLLKQDPHSQKLADIKLALAVMAVQLDVMAARRSSCFPTVPADPPDTEIDNSFAQRAMLAMKRIGE